MKKRIEFVSILKDFNFVQLRMLLAKIGHCHTDGGKELISQEVLGTLKGIGASNSWSPTDTPELNGVYERKFKILGERCLSMILRAG